tara:strand:+ start:117 stop:248 length:132 start_codon:yes stop_codon:yes gene_type:complete
VVYEINVEDKNETRKITASELIYNFVKEIIGMCHKKKEYDTFP